MLGRRPDHLREINPPRTLRGERRVGDPAYEDSCPRYGESDDWFRGSREGWYVIFEVFGIPLLTATLSISSLSPDGFDCATSFSTV